MALPKKTKDPAERLDYTFVFDGWMAEGDYLISAEVSFSEETGEGDIVIDEVVSFTKTSATAWISGGTTGVKYTVTCLGETNDGRIVERSFILEIKEL
jgi:hypothetical protein